MMLAESTYTQMSCSRNNSTNDTIELRYLMCLLFSSICLHILARASDILSMLLFSTYHIASQNEDSPARH